MSKPATTTGGDSAAQFLDRRTRIQRVQHVLHGNPALGPAIVLVVSLIVFSFLNERFYAPGNLSLILQQVAVVGALAVGQTLIILTAGIDLSVGAIMVLASMVMATLATEAGIPSPVALAIGFVVGMGAGLINGLLVTKWRLMPFIATLGTLSVFTALALMYSGGTTVRGFEMPALLTWTGIPLDFGPIRITTGVLLMLGLYLVVGFLLSQTMWGRHVYTVGDDSESARLAGIRVNWVLVSVYTGAGLVYGVAAWILIGRIDAASPNAGIDMNLDSITAVVIGGTSLFGGRGTILGTLIGALIVGVFRNGLSLAGFDSLYQTLAIGLLVLVAVAADQWIRRVRA